MYTQLWQPSEQDCDAFRHVNNVAYLAQLERIAWAHSAALGIGMAEFEAENCALVVRRHEIDYLRPAYVGQTLRVNTWLDGFDGKCTFWRHYRIFPCTSASEPHEEDPKQRILEAKTQWMSVSLDTGRLKRMPDTFKAIYWKRHELD